MQTRSAQLDLAHDVGAPRIARRFIAELLSTWGVLPAAIDRSQLLVSELVSNAIEHGRGPIRLAVTEVDPQAGLYRAEVCNRGSGRPSLRRVSHDGLSGRGLQLVDELAHEWGTTNTDGETRVWFELRAELVS